MAQGPRMNARLLQIEKAARALIEDMDEFDANDATVWVTIPKETLDALQSALNGVTWGVTCQGIGKVFWSSNATRREYPSRKAAQAEADRLTALNREDPLLRYGVAPREGEE